MLNISVGSEEQSLSTHFCMWVYLEPTDIAAQIKNYTMVCKMVTFRFHCFIFIDKMPFLKKILISLHALITSEINSNSFNKESQSFLF